MRFLVLLCLLASIAHAADRPNIVFIITDDQRWDCLSVAGHPFLKTPNIDRIANEGVLFENAFVTLPLCSPSRASFLTGQYNHKNGVVANTAAMGAISHKLDTWAIRLQKAGYETAGIGKFHMGVDDSPRPGFSHWAMFKGQGKYFDCPFNVNGTQTPTEGYVTDRITDYAVDFIAKERKGKPFAMWVGHKAVHGPYTPPPRHKDLYKDEKLPQREGVKDVDNVGKPALTRKVADPPVGHPAYGVSDEIIRDQIRCILSVDEGVGRILDALEKSNQLDDTLIVFTSDNGYFWNEHHLGDKRAAYEEAIRVPLVMRYPKLIPAASRLSEMVLNIDIAPTFIELGGAEPIPGSHGRSLVALFKREAKDWRNHALFEYFLEKAYPNIETWQAVRTQDWKYIHYPNLENMDELYDLKRDPNEMQNIIGDAHHAQHLAMLKSQLAALQESTK